MLRVKHQRRGAGKFAVFPSDNQYHLTKEETFAYHSSAYGKVKGVMLSSLCGSYISSVPDEGWADTDRKPALRLSASPPQGFLLCQTCARAATKQKGLVRLLAHFFYHWRGFRAASRSFGLRI
jgi:hypothetical protein